MTGTEVPFLPLSSPGFSTRSETVMNARRVSWCARSPYGLVVLRHREAGALLRDRRLRQGSHGWPDANGLEGSFADFWKRSIISREGETHRWLRGLASPALAPEHISELEPEFTTVAEKLVSEFDGDGRCEFMRDFATPFASQAICVLLGLEPGEWRRIGNDASALGLAMGVECKKHEPVFNAACDRLMQLSRELVARARRHDGDANYVSRLVERFDDSSCRNEQVLVDLILITIFGGVDTTRSQLGNAMALFARHPEQWRLLRRRPDLVRDAVEEAVRARPTTTWVTREALVDFSYRGVRIRSGQTLHLLVHATACDPEICGDSRFDITAQRKVHFGFGGGAHHCLGHLVARTDMSCALSVLARELDELSPAGDATWLPDSGNTGPVSLPIRFTRSGPESDATEGMAAGPYV